MKQSCRGICVTIFLGFVGAACSSSSVPSGSGGTDAGAGASFSGGASGSTAGGGVGGASQSGGMNALGGTVGSGGTTGSGGTATGGGGASGGAGGASGGGGSAGAAGTTGVAGPCDIYQSADTPCVAAHSTVRALYGSYGGKLYQVKRASDNTTKDISVLAPGGVADTAAQDAFCANTSCVIPIVYDQSPRHNDLSVSPKAYWLPDGGMPSSATLGKATVGGHTVYGIFVSSFKDNSVPVELKNVAYRNNHTTGVATGDQAEAMYMVVDGKRFNGGSSRDCCFDYGNASTTGNDEGNGTMEAIYWGADTGWGGKGDGNGPWVVADLENGLYKGDQGGGQAVTPSAKSIVAQFATAMLKGPSGNHFVLKGGNAQSGLLTTMWDGNRPANGYAPKKLQGAIILGTGGDGSNAGTGTFFEGAMTIGTPPDSVDDAIQSNIVAAGYGK